MKKNVIYGKMSSMRIPTRRKSAADLRFNSNSYSGGPTATFGAPMTADLHYSLYATYG